MPASDFSPTVQDVRDALAARIHDGGLPLSDEKIQAIIDRTAASLLLELPSVLPEIILPTCQAYVLFSSAAQVDDFCFPEQALEEGNSNAVRLDRRAGLELARLRGYLPSSSRRSRVGSVRFRSDSQDPEVVP